MTQKDGAIAPATLESWLDFRPSWLRMAAQGLVRDRRNPNDLEIEALVEHCLAEAAKTLTTKHPALAPGAILGTPSAGALRIESISEVRGVNAIGAGAVLDFSNGDMTVVYGPNGSGKSGYARLMKHICGARARGAIHGNVFRNEPESASAQVTVTGYSAVDGISTTTAVSWDSANGPHSKLNAVPVFDSATASELGDNPSEATYLPRSMRFVGALIGIADRVGKRLDERAAQLQSQLPTTPAEYAGTTAGNFLQTLKPTLDKEAISKACEFPAVLLQERLALETALAQANPAVEHTRVITDLERLTRSADTMAALMDSLSEAKALARIAALKSAMEKRQAANAYATSFLQGIPLKGVGEKVWETLWEAAKTFSTEFAYPGHAYPHVEEGAQCVLCQQRLEGEGKDRLRSFEQYLNSTLQTEAKAAELAVASLNPPSPKEATDPAWLAQCAATGLSSEQAETLANEINVRIRAMETATALTEIPAVTWSLWNEALAGTMSAKAAQRDALATLLNPTGRAQQEKRLRELKAQEWLSGLTDAASREVERLNRQADIAKALSLTKTTSLTTKSNEIGRLELAQGYCDRFNFELQALGGGNLPVRMKHKSSGKGIYSFYIELKEVTSTVKNRDILSEGEQRIVSLAAFIADATGADRELPVIFDDPISSLDQRYEELVAKRLVVLAEQRQVIVFTHRLSLMVLLKSAAKQRTESALKPVEVTVASIGRNGPSTGMPATIDAFSLKPKTGLEQMKSRIGMIKKQDADTRAIMIKADCSNFRILVERSVEDDLCSGVINRFRREVKTLNVLQRLHAITTKDCALINGMMTKYSAFEHSQPLETPSWLPEPDELLGDIQTMLDWIKDFDERAKKAAV